VTNAKNLVDLVDAFHAAHGITPKEFFELGSSREPFGDYHDMGLGQITDVVGNTTRQLRQIL